MTTAYRATVCIADGHEILIQDAGILAIRQRGQIEVWSADGETHFGNLPEDANEALIRAAAKFWGIGFFAGVSFGRDDTQANMRKAMGINT